MNQGAILHSEHDWPANPLRTYPQALASLPIWVAALIGVYGGILAAHLGTVLYVTVSESVGVSVSESLTAVASHAAVVSAWMLIAAAAIYGFSTIVSHRVPPVRAG